MHTKHTAQGLAYSQCSVKSSPCYSDQGKCLAGLEWQWVEATKRKNESTSSLPPPFLPSELSTAHLTSKNPMACVPQIHRLLSHVLPQLNFKENTPRAFVQWHTMENTCHRSQATAPLPLSIRLSIYLFILKPYLGPVMLAGLLKHP